MFSAALSKSSVFLDSDLMDPTERWNSEIGEYNMGEAENLSIR